MKINRKLFFAVLSWLLATSTDASSEFPVDKVYHPYVLPLEREVEWRFTSQQSDAGNQLLQRMAYGHSLSDKLTLEAYLVGARDQNDDFGIEAYELEARWMLTEQGQLWADWGALFELEKQHNEDSWELTAGLLTEKEFGRYSLTTNLLLSYEWGQDSEKELETELRAKYRYRWKPQFQPGIEVYFSEEYLGIGPASMGVYRFDRQKQIKWELAFISGLNGDSKDHTLRFAIEYEF